MAATIIMKNWSKEGDTQKLSCGSFVIDDFSFSGTPVKLKLEALALPADSSFKETQRTKTYEKTTLFFENFFRPLNEAGGHQTVL